MQEVFNTKIQKRIIFAKGKQNEFVIHAKDVSGLSWIELAERVGIHRRTLSDWRRERYTISESGLDKICEIAKIKRPLDLTTRDAFWYTSIGGKIAGRSNFKKYGREIKIPKEDERLAEFIGIMLGDGGMTKTQVRVTLNSKTDAEYVKFVQNLIKTLFDVEPSLQIVESRTTTDVIVSRVKLVAFCESIGLKVGSKLKNGSDIPKWINKNDAFKMNCIRGLFDTDGCIFGERHKIKNKTYEYPRWAFVSASEYLLQSTFTILRELDFSPKIRNNRSVQLESRADIIRYFEVIGTSNLKHRNRFNRILFKS